MSGHSKWANIKHRKEGADKRRGILFSRLSKEIMVAARLGGADVSSNPRLRIAVSRARSCNMPRDTIERAIKKGTGELEGISYEEVSYPVFASGGVALIIESLTDKKSRTTPEIKSILSKYDANLAEMNAVARLFERRGYISIAADSISNDEKLFEIAVEAGAEDVRRKKEGECIAIYTAPADYANVSEALAAAELTTIESGIQLLPIVGSEVHLQNEEQSAKVYQLIAALEDHDDVQAIYTNLEID